MLFCYLLQMLLHTLLATSGLLSYCFLPIISKWSSHPPLTSINKALSLLSPNAPGLKGGVLLQIVLVMLLLTDY